jgi:hypothetical protein
MCISLGLDKQLVWDDIGIGMPIIAEINLNLPTLQSGVEF